MVTTAYCKRELLPISDKVFAVIQIVLGYVYTRAKFPDSLEFGMFSYPIRFTVYTNENQSDRKLSHMHTA